MQKRKKRITIKEVANHAGVSIGTVSRLIGNSGYVGQESKKKIEEAIRELSYIPNTTARSMVKQKSNIIGVAVPEINNPFLAELVVQIESNLSKKNYSIMLCNTGYNLKKTAAFIDDLIMRNAEGIILVATDISEKKLLKKIEQYMSGVSVGQRILDFDCINFTDYKSAYDMTEYLIKIGHERIACIGFNVNSSQTVERLDGVMSALRNNGISICEEYMIEYQSAENGGYVCAKKLLELKQRPTAIVAINDFYALGAYEAVYEKGLKIGDDISIAGFDDIGIAKFISPSLTTVNCDKHAISKLATDLLMRKIEGDYKLSNDGKKFGKEIVLSSQIMLRDSTKSIMPEKHIDNNKKL